MTDLIIHRSDGSMWELGPWTYCAVPTPGSALVTSVSARMRRYRASFTRWMMSFERRTRYGLRVRTNRRKPLIVG